MRRQLGGRLQKSLELGTGADCPLCRHQLLSPAEKEQQFSPRLRDRYARRRSLSRLIAVLFRLLMMTRVQMDYAAPGAGPLLQEL